MSHVQETIDSQNLFSQFDPTLFFENPVPCNEWYILAEQIVPTSVASFWETIVKKKYNKREKCTKCTLETLDR